MIKHYFSFDQKLNYCCWVLSLVVLAASIFAGYPLYESYPKHTALMLGLYFAISRISLSVALCYMIFACVHNAGGQINWFLSHPHWELFSKLSYAIYLTHYPILLVAAFSMNEPVNFSEISAFHLFIGLFALSTLVSILVALAFEMPIDNIYRLIKRSGYFSNASKFINKPNNLNCEKIEKKIE